MSYFFTKNLQPTNGFMAIFIPAVAIAAILATHTF